MTRAVQVARHCREDVTILSSAGAPAGWPHERWVDLPDDAGEAGDDPTAGGTLHWAPIGHAGFAERMHSLARWADLHRPALLVSDVSVEVALLTRLLGIRSVVTLMAGDRSDRAHQAGYDAATLLVAAWPGGVGSSPVGGWQERWRPKTHWVGGLSRVDGRRAGRAPGGRRVVLLVGRGGTGGWAPLPHTPGWQWCVPDGDSPDQVWRALQRADVVVTHAGQNALAEVAAARRPAVIVADPRPHDEQNHLAAAAASMGAAIVAERPTEPHGWLPLLERALDLGGEGWAGWSDGSGARRYADLLDGLAASGW